MHDLINTYKQIKREKKREQLLGESMIEIVSDIPKEFVIGRKYHCSWAKNRGMVWVLMGFDKEKDEAILMTPRTRKELKTKLSSLRNINKYCETKLTK